MEVEITRGQRVAQLICESCCYPQLVEITDEDNSMTHRDVDARGARGFGSTDCDTTINLQPSTSTNPEVHTSEVDSNVIIDSLLSSENVVNMVIDSVLMSQTWRDFTKP